MGGEKGLFTSRLSSRSVWSDETVISFSPRPRRARWLLRPDADGDDDAEGDAITEVTWLSSRGFLLSEGPDVIWEQKGV